MSGKNPVRHVPLPERLLNYTALRIGTVQDGKTAVRFLGPAHLGHDGRGHKRSLLLLSIGTYQFYKFSPLPLREAFLLQLHLVLGNEGVGRIHNGLGRAVVLLQPVFLCLRIVFPEIEDILNPGTTETVDTLGIITHHRDILVYSRQLLDYQILRIVGILILIHHHKLEPAADTLHGIGKIPEQDIGKKEDVIKIHGTGLTAFLCILPVDFPNPRLLCRRIILDEGTVAAVRLCCNQIVLGHGDAAVHLVGLVYLIIQLQLLYAGLNHIAAVCSVIDGKSLWKAQKLSLFPEEPDKD